MPTPRLPTMLTVSRRVYSSLLWLCPAEYRRAYGPPMRQAFADLAREARYAAGMRGVLRLWLRVFADLVATALREHLAALSHGGGIMLEDHPCTPHPWWQVGLAVLPGIVLAAGERLQPTFLARLLGSPGHGWPLVALAVLLVAALVWRRRVPPWALPALGLLFGVAVAGPLFPLLGLPGALAAVAYLGAQGSRRRGLPAPSWALLVACLCLSLLPALGAALGLPFLPRSLGWLGWLNPWSLLGIGATLLVALVALPLARPHGLPAGLFVLAAGFALWEETFDLLCGLASTFWGNTMLAILAVLLLVAAPLWALRARSLHDQARGLLVPVAVALAGVVAVDTIVRTEPAILEGLLHRTVTLDESLGISYGSSGPALLAPFLLRNGLVVVQLLLALLLAVVLYARAQAAGAPREGET